MVLNSRGQLERRLVTVVCLVHFAAAGMAEASTHARTMTLMLSCSVLGATAAEDLAFREATQEARRGFACGVRVLQPERGA